MAASASNTLLTITSITREGLDVLTNGTQFAKTCSKPRKSDNLWNKKGMKAGTTIYLRKPPRYTIRSGTLTASYQASLETQVPFTIDVAGVDTSFTHLELATDIDDYRERFLVPQMEEIYNHVDAAGLAYYYKVANSIGTVGTPPSTALDLLTARAILIENGFSRDSNSLFCALNPMAGASLVNGLKGLFNSQDRIRRQFETGEVGDEVYGFGQVYSTANIANHTTGTVNTATLTNGVSVDDDVHVDMDTGAGALAIGDVFTVGVAGTKPVFNVNPRTRASTGRLKQFVCDEVEASVVTAVSLDPYALGGKHSLQDSGAFQNINAHIQDGAVVNFAGTGDADSGVGGGTSATADTSPQNLAYHKSAFMFGCIPLDDDTPGAESYTETDEESGCILNFSTQYNIDERENKARWDVVFGYAVPYPEGAVRIWS
jgi:hypothetical protein